LSCLNERIAEVTLIAQMGDTSVIREETEHRQLTNEQHFYKEAIVNQSANEAEGANCQQ
jgi:hypothetical protein